MGCIVQWNNSDRLFHCPCHGGLFTEYGKPANGSGRLRYLSALPRLNVKVENGKVYVEVPRSTT
jgi:Rieske Fe-S protein